MTGFGHSHPGLIIQMIGVSHLGSIFHTELELRPVVSTGKWLSDGFALSGQEASFRP